MDKTSWEVFRDSIAGYLALMKSFWPQFRHALLWIGAMQALSLLEPWMVKHVIDGITEQSPFVREHLFAVSMGMLVVLVAIGGAQIKKNKHIGEVLQVIERELPVACGRKLLRLPLVYHQSENTGIVIGKVVRGVGRTIDLTAMCLWEIVPLVLQTTMTAVIMIAYGWYTVLFFLPIVAVFGWVTVRVRLKFLPQRMERHDLDSDADELLGQAVTNVMTTQAFAQEEREMGAITLLRNRVYRMEVHEFGHYRRSDFLRTSLINVGRVGIIFICAWAAFGNRMTMGTLFFLSTLAEKVFLSCYRIGAIFDQMIEASEPVTRMVGILHEPETLMNSIVPRPFDSRPVGEIVFDRVTFAYKKRGENGDGVREPALREVNLTIRSGETVGVVGESGGGKSTLVKLLMRFGDPNHGSICLDGVDVRERDVHAFRRHIGYVPQEVEIYDTSVAANIAYGNPNASRAQIERAAQVANADAFITELPHGYDEVVGNRGLRLSGGQRQRIGIARAVLLDPPILVFDEATSHVDVVSERKIQRAIEELRRGRTVILIAHRLSTVQNADRIVVVDRGRIKEIGTHTELVRRNGIYHRLVELQTRVEAVM